MTTTVRFLVINCDSASAKPDHVADVLRLGIAQGADVILGCELNDVRAENVDQDNVYEWFQAGQRLSAASGCAIGVRKGFALMTDPHLRLGSFETSEGSRKTGSGIRDRFIAIARLTLLDGTTFRVAAGHAPPPRSPNARAEFMRAFANTRAKFKGGDMNLGRRLASRALGRRVVGADVLWLTMPRRGWKLEVARKVKVGGDHPAISVVVHKKPRKNDAGTRRRLAEIPT